MNQPILTLPEYWRYLQASTKGYWHKVAAMSGAWVVTHRIYITGHKPAKGTRGQLMRIASAKHVSSKIAELDATKLIDKGFVFVGEDGGVMSLEASRDYLIQLKMEQAFK